MNPFNRLIVHYCNKGDIFKTYKHPLYDNDGTSIVEYLKYLAAKTTEGMHGKLDLYAYYGFLAEISFKFDMFARGHQFLHPGHYENGADLGDFVRYKNQKRYVFDVKSSYLYRNISILPRQDIDIDAYIGIYIQPHVWGEYDDPENMEGIDLCVYGWITPKNLHRYDLGYCPHSILIAPERFTPCSALAK